MNARIRKHSLTIAGHRTSISLEDPFWDALRDAARAKGVSVAELVGDIDRDRGETGLSSAIRIHLLDHYRDSGRKP